MIESNPSLASLLGAASDALAALSGHTVHWQAAAPGRVNLIGEHTDYNAGLSARRRSVWNQWSWRMVAHAAGDVLVYAGLEITDRP